MTTKEVCARHGTANRKLPFASLLMGGKLLGLYECLECEREIDLMVMGYVLDEIAEGRE